MGGQLAKRHHHILHLLKQMATKKILEKMKQDESHRSFEGSSGVHSDGDDLDDTDDDDAASNLGADGSAEPGTSKPAKVIQ